MTEPNELTEPTEPVDTEPKKSAYPANEWEFRGYQKMTYPGHLHPERDGVLEVEPNEVIDFGDALPPGDGQWYDVASGEPHVTAVPEFQVTDTDAPPPSVEAATSAQEDAESPEG